MDNNTLINAMTVEQLEAMKEANRENEGVVTLINGILLARQSEVLKVEVEAKFAKDIEKLTTKLPHPDNAHNVYLAWQEVEQDDTTQPAEEVDVVDDSGSHSTEQRFPKVKVSKWVVTVNKAMNLSGGSKAKSESTLKRAITVSKVSESDPNQLVPVGNFKTAVQACKHLDLDATGTSGNRVLRDNGYIERPYNGNDFTS